MQSVIAQNAIHDYQQSNANAFELMEQLEQSAEWREFATELLLEMAEMDAEDAVTLLLAGMAQAVTMMQNARPQLGVVKGGKLLAFPKA